METINIVEKELNKEEISNNAIKVASKYNEIKNQVFSIYRKLRKT